MYSYSYPKSSFEKVFVGLLIDIIILNITNDVKYIPKQTPNNIFIVICFIILFFYNLKLKNKYITR